VSEASDAHSERRLFRFGVFELDTATGELTKEGRNCPRIRDQALLILSMLLEKPGELVTREELRERLWSADTFVDFDHGLNTAMNQIRNALGDAATNPRFIQTLPRRGYRFIAPVQAVTREGAAVSGGGKQGAFSDAAAKRESGSASARADAVEGRSAILSDAADLPVMGSKATRILFALIQIMYLSFYVVCLARLAAVEAALRASENLSALLFGGVVLTAVVGIPVRLYLLTAAAMNYPGLSAKFRRLFPFVLVLDELWALAPFLLVAQIGVGLAMASTAALLFLPFSQRALLLMGSSEKLQK
jgi:DNA-binding winged helix-turn-helix (wHTH) protein